MAEEIWKDVVGYEGLYQVSTLGRVRSLDRIIHKNNWRYHNVIKKDPELLERHRKWNREAARRRRADPEYRARVNEQRRRKRKGI